MKNKEKTHIKTHRCEQLLERNKNANGLNVAIRYGQKHDRPYEDESPTWWLDHLEFDLDWDSTWMSPVCTIFYCPFCGKNLDESE